MSAAANSDQIARKDAEIAPRNPPMSAAATSADPAPVELSVVIPCLNEAETLASCIAKARRASAEHGIATEIIVADNGSTDGSRRIAREAGAVVVEVAAKGYGAALMGGIAAARGRYVLMGDADDSYDFSELPKFVFALRQGADLVQGCRLPAGGGTVLPGAMPPLHRWLGNPLFSLVARLWFGSPVHDIYCGLRAFTKSFYGGLNLCCTGMEFATEMIVKASLRRARMAEVPITLHPDGRTLRAPHLRTFRDGWRTLRFFLMCSPRWLFAVPGLALIALGLLGYGLALPGVRIGPAALDAHTLLVASLFMMCGYQALLFAVFTKVFTVSERLLPADRRYERFFAVFTLERGIVLSAVAIAVGTALLAVAAWRWAAAGFGALDYARTMRLVVPGATAVALGVQTLFSSFMISILGGLSRR